MKAYLPAITIAAAILGGFGIHACANRYVHMSGSKVLDKWTGYASYR